MGELFGSMARDSLGSCSSKSPASSREATEDVISFKTVDAPPTPASRLEPEPTVPLANITSRRERRGLRKGALKGGALRGGAKRVTKVEAGTPDSLVDVSQLMQHQPLSCASRKRLSRVSSNG